MSTTAVLTNYVAFTGDVNLEYILSSGELVDSPAMSAIISLVSGNNTITPPDVEGFTLHGLAIVPPESNTVELTLKGVNGDTGITLGASVVSVISFGATPPATLVLEADDDVDGFRLIWF